MVEFPSIECALEVQMVQEGFREQLVEVGQDGILREEGFGQKTLPLRIMKTAINHACKAQKKCSKDLI